MLDWRRCTGWGSPAEREEFLTAVEATVYYLKNTRSPRDVYYAVGHRLLLPSAAGGGV